MSEQETPQEARTLVEKLQEQLMKAAESQKGWAVAWTRMRAEQKALLEDMLAKVKPIVIDCVPAGSMPPVFFYTLASGSTETIGMVQVQKSLQLTSTCKLVEATRTEDYGQWKDGAGECQVSIIRKPISVEQALKTYDIEAVVDGLVEMLEDLQESYDLVGNLEDARHRKADEFYRAWFGTAYEP